MLKELKIPFFTVLFIFLGFFLFTKVFGPLPFSVTTVTTTKDSLFTSEGLGEVTAVPDTAIISLGVNKEAKTVESAKDQVNEIINKITADLKGLGVEAKDIKTINYSVNPNYDYSLGKQTLNGYSVTADIQVKLKPIEKANQAVDIATKDGATNAGGVQFTFDDEKKKDLQNQARKLAVKNAKEKAQDLANAAGIKLGKIIDIQENTGGYGAPAPMAMDAANKTRELNQSAPTELNPGENKVSVTVTLSYETY